MTHPEVLKETRVHVLGHPSWEFGTHQDDKGTKEDQQQCGAVAQIFSGVKESHLSIYLNCLVSSWFAL